MNLKTKGGGRNAETIAFRFQNITILLADRTWKILDRSHWRALRHRGAGCRRARTGCPQMIDPELGGRTDGAGFGREIRFGISTEQSIEIERPTRLWTGSRKTATTERLNADNRADQITIHVNVAGRC